MADSGRAFEDSEFEFVPVSHLAEDNYSNWMGNLINEKQLCPLKDLAIPGSHDSGTFFLDQTAELGPDEPPMIHNLASVFGKLAKNVVYNWSVTQTLNIYEQLMAGIRYLDLRVAFRAQNKEFRIVHGLYGCEIEEVMQDIKLFVTEHPKEIVIMDFNHFYNMEDEAHHRLADSLLGMFGEILRNPGKDGANVTLQELWANEEKVIIFYQNSDVVKSYPCFWSSNLICSPWANTADRKVLLEFLNEKCTRSNMPKDGFHVAQAIVTPQTSTLLQNMTSTLKDACAVRCICHVTGWLKVVAQSPRHKFNIVMTDFVEFGDFIPTVVSLNYYY